MLKELELRLTTLDKESTDLSVGFIVGYNTEEEVDEKIAEYLRVKKLLDFAKPNIIRFCGECGKLILQKQCTDSMYSGLCEDCSDHIFFMVDLDGDEDYLF